MTHKLYQFQFTSLTSESWDAFPDFLKMEKQIAQAALAHCELSGEAFGLYAPPHEIREIRMAQAVYDQIRSMWHGHRERGRIGPPTIPLKVFVIGFGQESSRTWASIEVLPGLDNWEASSSEDLGKAYVQRSKLSKSVNTIVKERPNKAINAGKCKRRSAPLTFAGYRGEDTKRVESRCGAVAVGLVCLLPPLSSGGARVTLP